MCRMRVNYRRIKRRLERKPRYYTACKIVFTVEVELELQHNAAVSQQLSILQIEHFSSTSCYISPHIRSAKKEKSS
jgi:hypothetical protein